MAMATSVPQRHLEELGRPRIDVTVRISGFFRDAFPPVVAMLDDAVRADTSVACSPPHRAGAGQRCVSNRSGEQSGCLLTAGAGES
jgi:hypothetical protein